MTFTLVMLGLVALLLVVQGVLLVVQLCWSSSGMTAEAREILKRVPHDFDCPMHAGGDCLCSAVLVLENYD